MKIKFCGIRRDEDIEHVNTLRPDYIGFIMFSKSKRYVSSEQAKELIRRISKDGTSGTNTVIKSVGVFVNEDFENLIRIAQHCGFDIVQLHGNEDNAYIAELKRRTSLEVWKVFREPEFDAENSSADKLLYDVSDGTGTPFNYEKIKNFTSAKPLIIAGGIDITNIEKAMSLQPYAVDLSSGIETDGVKDFDKMKQIIDFIEGQ
jgi:phosphoribosylanthranilate isomerase